LKLKLHEAYKTLKGLYAEEQLIDSYPFLKDEIEYIFRKYSTNGGLVIAFLHFAYTKESPFLSKHKLRSDNVSAILKFLGVKNGTDIFDDIISQRTDNAKSYIKALIEYQKDWRIDTVIVQEEKVHKQMAFVNEETRRTKQQKTADGGYLDIELTDKEIAEAEIKKNELFEQIKVSLSDIDKTWSDIERDYRPLNDVLDKEGIKPISRVNLGGISKEAFIREMQNRRKENADD
jgi:hypothetical protein